MSRLARTRRVLYAIAFAVCASLPFELAWAVTGAVKIADAPDDIGSFTLELHENEESTEPFATAEGPESDGSYQIAVEDERRYQPACIGLSNEETGEEWWLGCFVVTLGDNFFQTVNFGDRRPKGPTTGPRTGTGSAPTLHAQDIVFNTTEYIAILTPATADPNTVANSINSTGATVTDLFALPDESAGWQFGVALPADPTFNSTLAQLQTDGHIASFEPNLCRAMEPGPATENAGLSGTAPNTPLSAARVGGAGAPVGGSITGNAPPGTAVFVCEQAPDPLGPNPGWNYTLDPFSPLWTNADETGRYTINIPQQMFALDLTVMGALDWSEAKVPLGTLLAGLAIPVPVGNLLNALGDPVAPWGQAPAGSDGLDAYGVPAELRSCRESELAEQEAVHRAEQALTQVSQIQDAAQNEQSSTYGTPTAGQDEREQLRNEIITRARRAARRAINELNEEQDSTNWEDVGQYFSFAIDVTANSDRVYYHSRGKQIYAIEVLRTIAQYKDEAGAELTSEQRHVLDGLETIAKSKIREAHEELSALDNALLLGAGIDLAGIVCGGFLLKSVTVVRSAFARVFGRTAVRSGTKQATKGTATRVFTRLKERLFATKQGTPTKMLDAGEGFTDEFGNYFYSTLGTQTEKALVKHHEELHSILRPSLRLFRNIRAKIWLTGYKKSQFLKGLEEALVESYAQLRVRGIRGLPDAISFPIREGYVDLIAFRGGIPVGVIPEGAIGAITFGGVQYGVYHVASD